MFAYVPGAEFCAHGKRVINTGGGVDPMTTWIKFLTRIPAMPAQNSNTVGEKDKEKEGSEFKMKAIAAGPCRAENANVFPKVMLTPLSSASKFSERTASLFPSSGVTLGFLGQRVTTKGQTEKKVMKFAFPRGEIGGEVCIYIYIFNIYMFIYIYIHTSFTDR